jgi:hypothetical protein
VFSKPFPDVDRRCLALGAKRSPRMSSVMRAEVVRGGDPVMLAGALPAP